MDNKSLTEALDSTISSLKATNEADFKGQAQKLAAAGKQAAKKVGANAKKLGTQAKKAGMDTAVKAKKLGLKTAVKAKKLGAKAATTWNKLPKKGKVGAALGAGALAATALAARKKAKNESFNEDLSKFSN